MESSIHFSWLGPCRDAAEQGEAPDPPPCGSVEDVLALLEDDYRRAYFLTGTGFFLHLAAFFHQGFASMIMADWRLIDYRAD